MKNNISNARYMSYDEVAASFVITKNFERLLTTGHSFIMGPRGCGKTTMLKMFNPHAAFASKLLDRIPFWGIYIPSDQQWKSQFDAVQYSYGVRNSQFAKKISKAMVNINVLIAYCETINAIWDFAGVEEGEEMYTFFSKIVELWKLEKPIAPTLSSIEMRLRSFLMDIDEAVSNNNWDYKFPYVCSVNFTTLIVTGITCFEEVFYDMECFKEHKKWAICMDEMEIAPDWLLADVMSSMRSIDQRVVFKITAVPSQTIAERNFIAASEGNDFDVIRVWNYNKQSQDEWVDFVKIMLDKMILNSNNIDYSKLVEMISSIENHQFSVNPKQALDDVVEKLKSVDNSFYRYVLNKNVDLNEVLASDVKKSVMIFPYFTLLQRLKLLQYKQSETFNENRLYDVYMNAWLLTEYCDGNPRALINFYTALNDLIQFSKHNNRTKTIDIPSFAQKLKNFSHSKVYNKLAYQSMGPITYKNHSYTYKEILDIVGEKLCSMFSLEDFVLSPDNLFTVGTTVFEPFIKTALESGAIILIEDNSEYRGVRNGVPVYRLNYGLYPYYHIVKTNSKHVLYLEDMIDSNIMSIQNEN